MKNLTGHRCSMYGRCCSFPSSISAFICVYLRIPSRLPASLFDAKLLAEPLGDHDEEEEREDEEHAKGGELDVLAVLPQLPDHDRDHLGAGAVEQDRARQLADRHDHDVDPP